MATLSATKIASPQREPCPSPNYNQQQVPLTAPAFKAVPGSAQWTMEDVLVKQNYISPAFGQIQKKKKTAKQSHTTFILDQRPIQANRETLCTDTCCGIKINAEKCNGVLT